METKIGPDFRKPFRGLTTIQLFDKNTGELLEEYHDENTYNDRLQYINYLDTVLKCKSRNVPSTVTPFSHINKDNISGNNSSSDEFFFDILSNYAIGSGSGSSLRVRQLFATLWLTNSTTAETAHGYPNGLPVGVVDTAGNNPAFIGLACSGALNVSESYVGNDRLHLVFDFATDKCNVQFDALWLFPSMYRTYASPQLADCYNVTSFYQIKEISAEVLNTQLLYTYPFFTINHRINGIYTVLGYSKSGPGTGRSTSALQVLNNSTGEIVSTVEWPVDKYIYPPMYYDAGTNTLYILQADTKTSPDYILASNNDNCALYKLDMSSGTLTKVDNLYNMLGLRWSDFNAVSTGAKYTFVNAFKKDGSVATIFRLTCTSAIDSSTKNYFVLFNFDPVTETFTQIKKFEVFNKDAYESTYMFMIDDIVYLMYPLSSTQQTNYKYSAFDINTGAIKSTNILSANANILSNSWMYNGTSAGRNVYLLFDQATYRRAICGTSSVQDVVACKVLKNNYFTAPWSTHNKLTSAIKKTNMTTMKIQYDIVWDSIPDVILPALL